MTQTDDRSFADFMYEEDATITWIINIECANPNSSPLEDVIEDYGSVGLGTILGIPEDELSKAPDYLGDWSNRDILEYLISQWRVKGLLASVSIMIRENIRESGYSTCGISTSRYVFALTYDELLSKIKSTVEEVVRSFYKKADA